MEKASRDLNDRLLSDSGRNDFLRIGDIVILKHAKPNEGYLAAEGTLSDDCVLAKSTSALYDCLWQIRVQHQYNATAEYFEALLNLEETPEFDAHNKTFKLDSLAQLLRSAQNEQRLNKKLMSMKMGKPVAFGDVIHLRHLKSKKLLTVSASVLAKQERENMRVELRTQGDAMSWLEFMPRYKYDREGQPIANHTELHIRVHERSSEYIHAARKASRTATDGEKEINCSLESSSWTISIYQQARHMNTKNLLVGNLISLQEPETSTYITLEQQKPHVTNHSKVVMSQPVHLSFASSDCNVGTNLLWMIEGENPLKGGIVSHRHERIALRDLNTGLYMKCEDGGVVAVPSREDCTLFEVVSNTVTDIGQPIHEGGLIQLYTKGLWCSQAKTIVNNKSVLEFVSDRSAALSFVVSAKLQNMLKIDVFVGVEACVALRKFEISVRNGTLVAETPGLVDFRMRQMFAIMEFVVDFLSSTSSDNEDLLHQEAVEGSDIAVVNQAALAVRQTMMREQGILDVLLDIIELCASGALQELQDKAVYRGIQASTKLRHDKDDSKSAEDESSDSWSKTKSAISRHGKLRRMNSSGVSSIVEDIVKQKRRSGSIDGGNRRHDVLPILDNRDPSLSSRSLSQDISQAAFSILLLAISKNHVNQIYIADKFPILLNQVKYSELAVKCVQEMLRDNLQMLQTKVREREIRIFLELLEETEMNVTLLNLLKSTCSCPIGVDSTQRMVANALYRHETEAPSSPSQARGPGLELVRSLSNNSSVTYESIILRIIEEWKICTKVNIPEKKMYFPPNEAEMLNVKGYKLIADGLPQLYISWGSSSDDPHGDYSMVTLFGYSDKVPLKFLCNLTSNRRSMMAAFDIVKRPTTIQLENRNIEHRDSSSPAPASATTPSSATTPQNSNLTPTKSARASMITRKRVGSIINKPTTTTRKNKRKTMNTAKKSVFERKMQVSEYFVAQMYLAAELCLDRNYVAIGLLERSYSYDMLVSILWSVHVPNRFKAPVCRLLRCLYVDREPQVEAKFPRLIKTSVSLSGGEENAFSDHHSGSPYVFGLLQLLISDYLHHQLDITKCDELSAEMLDLLLSLMKFGFYNTAEQIQDVIDPLVEVLDNHRSKATRSSLPDVEEGGLNINNIFAVSLAAAKLKRKDSSQKSNKYQIAPTISEVEPDPDGDSLVTSSVKKSSPPPRRPSIFTFFFSRSASLPPSPSRVGSVEASTSERRPSIEGGLDSVKFNQDSVKGLDQSSSEMTQSWEQVTLSNLESIRFLVVILSLVVITTVLSAVQLVQNKNQNTPFARYFDLAVSIVFMAELALRMVCYTRINREMLSFLTNFFNVVDVAVVTLDVVILAMNDKSGLGGAASFSKALRTIRILRVVRIIRAARLLKKIADRATTTHVWSTPVRYNAVTENEVRTIAGILRVLSVIHARIQDRKLSTCIKSFVVWNEKTDPAGKHSDPVETYKHVLETDKSNSATIPQRLDEVLLDVAMYDDEVLTQEALHLLMLHKSDNQLLLQYLKRVQIIVTPVIEQKFKQIVLDLREMKYFAEAFEIWGSFVRPSDFESSKKLMEVLVDVIELIKSSAPVKSLDCDVQVKLDVEVQQMLYNLDAVGVLMTLQEALLDASLGTPHEQVQSIIKLCNRLLCLFMTNNEANQEIVFKRLPWFINAIDSGVNSSKVIRAMLSGNRSLIKQCPKKYIAEFMQKLVTEGKKAEYLDLFVGLTDVAETADSGVASLRNEISRHITNVDRANIFLRWCAPANSKNYNKRVEAMKPYVTADPPPLNDELSNELQYHINILQLLAGCKLGPKLQAVYPLDDLVAAIIDTATIQNIRLELGVLLRQIVETRPDGIEAAESMWQFFESVVTVFEISQTDIPLLLRKPEKAVFRYQRAVWMKVCSQIISNFILFFDYVAFSEAASFETDGFAVTHRSEDDVQTILKRMMTALRTLILRQGDYLGKSLMEHLQHCVNALSTIVVDLPADAPDENLVFSRAKRRTQVTRQKSLADEIQQVYTRKQFEDYTVAIENAIMNENSNAVELFENLPRQQDQVTSDIRLEPLLLKITSHFRNSILRTSTSHSLDSENNSIMWILTTLRLILENSVGTTVTELCDTKINIEIFEVSWLHEVMDKYGVTFLCLDLIAVGIDTSVSMAAVKVLIVLLGQTGGNLAVQQSVYRYLSETDSTLFFEQIKELIEQQMLWLQREAEAHFDGTPLADLPDEIMILKFLRALCDGNFTPTKNILREQDGNSRFVNILDYLAGYVDHLSRLECHACTMAAICLMHTLLGLLQGPCSGNQEHFVLHTELLVALNRLMRASRPSQDFTKEWEVDLETLKEYVIDVLRACIEGQTAGSVVLERVQTVIELNVLNVLIIPSETDEFGDVVDISELSRLQAKYLVFLQTLDDTRTDTPANVKRRIEEDVGHVEVLWNKELHLHYYHIPSISKSLSESSKVKLLNEMVCATQELKLKDFMKKARDIYTEAMHQKQLKAVGLTNVWNIKENVTWLMFFNVLLMNFFLLFYYVDRGDGELELTAGTGEIVRGLNTLHVALSIMTLAICLVARVPVTYMTAIDAGRGNLHAVLRALTDPLPVWYGCYLAITVLSLTRNNLLLSLLLLDFIVLDSTSRDVLYAVVIPARQLFSTFVIMTIALYISGVLVFYYFRFDFIRFSDSTNSMYDSVLASFNFGIRATEGLGQYLFDTIGVRLIFDVAIYFVIVVILRNIFFGIIINTFGELRAIKEEREEHIANRCFICGTDRHAYDKSSTNNMDFKYHISVTHSLWYYLYFVMHIWEQPRDQDNSLEAYVRRCIEVGDIGWFPIGQIGVKERQDENEDYDTNATATTTKRRNSRLIAESLTLLHKKLIDGNAGSTSDSAARSVQSKLTPVRTSITILQQTLARVTAKIDSMHEPVVVADPSFAGKARPKMKKQRTAIPGTISGPPLMSILKPTTKE